MANLPADSSIYTPVYNLQDTEKFIRWWFANVSAGSYFEIRMETVEVNPETEKPYHPTKFFKTPEDAIAFCKELTKKKFLGSVWYGLQPRARESGTSEDVLEITYWGNDFDHKDKGKDGTNQETYDKIREWANNPLKILLEDEGINCCINLSGNCCQAVMKHPAKINDDKTRDEHRENTMKLGKRILDAIPLEGIFTDEVKDCARVLRLPGFPNPKGGRTAEIVCINVPEKANSMEIEKIKMPSKNGEKYLEKALSKKLGEHKRYEYLTHLAGVMASLRYTPDQAMYELAEFTKNNCKFPEGEKTRQMYITNAMSSYEYWMKNNKPLEGKEKDEEKMKQMSSYIGKDFFADAVIYNGKIVFAKVDKEGVSLCDSIITDESKQVYPIGNDVDSRLLKLPEIYELPNGKEDIKKVYADLEKTIKKVWDAGSDTNHKFFALWICGSYRYDLVGVAPYLRLHGPFGSGKTRGLDVIANVGLRPISFGPGMTEAVIFRLCEQFKPCACLNEFDEKSNSEYSSVAVQLLNSRYERGHPIARIGGRDNDRIDLFDPFGPTAFSARTRFSDSSLESRILEIQCEETDREDIPDIINPEEFNTLFKPIRDKLYLVLRLYYSAEREKMPDASEMPRRFRQVLSAMWGAIHPDLLPELKELIKQMKEEEQEKLQNSDEGLIWWAIFDRAKEYWALNKHCLGTPELLEKQLKEKPLTLIGKQIEEIIGIPEGKRTGRKGGRILGSMGFKLDKKHEGRFWVCSEKLWKKMLTRTGYPENFKAVPLPWRYGGDISEGVALKTTFQREEENKDNINPQENGNEKMPNPCSGNKNVATPSRITPRKRHASENNATEDPGEDNATEEETPENEEKVETVEINVISEKEDPTDATLNT